MGIGHDDGVVDGVAVTGQTRDIPRLDLDRFSESLGQVEVVRARYRFILCIVKTSAKQPRFSGWTSFTQQTWVGSRSAVTIEAFVTSGRASDQR